MYNKTRYFLFGFTLLELLVVLVILGLLASLVGPQVLKQLSGSKTKTANLQIKELGTALDLFRLEVGRYPSSSEGLEALLRQPADTRGWNGPYLTKKNLPRDPWGNDYQYRYPGHNGAYDLFSLGADNQEGGEGEARDVGSWE
ncbi:type II secretion system major pseudopilin GspG [Zobellella aerophila]|uniref:Type II secretion system core protein G n=1 Tax=Zobellella aerophila TaxID=870480 RepID=A0ABP6WDH1_9GAMM